MIDIRLVRENPEKIRAALKNRCVDESILDELLELDKARREAISTSDRKKAERNKISSQIAKAKASGDEALAKELMEKAKDISVEVKELSEKAKKLDEEMRNKLLYIPNIPHESVPVGESEEDNVVVRKWGEPRQFDFDSLAHWDLGPNLGMMDFERAAKLSGSRFVILRKELARLERALINFMLDLHTREHGYEEVALPHLVKRETMQATGQLPKFEEEAYKTDPDDMFLIPTAEVPLVF